MTDVDQTTCDAIVGGGTDDLWRLRAVDDWLERTAFADAFPQNL